MHHSLRLNNISQLPLTLRRKAHDAVNGSLEALQALCAATLQMSDTNRTLLLPVFYAALDVPDIPSMDQMTAENFPFSSFHRIVLAIGAVSNISVIHPLALKDLWKRLWVGVQLLDFATQLRPESFSNAGIGPINCFCMIERFLYEDGEGPINSTEGVWILVGKSWRAMLQREDIFGDLAFNKLCRFLARAAITHDNVEELIVGAGGTTEFALVIVQHIKLTKFTIGTLTNSVYLRSVLSFLFRTKEDEASLRSELLECGIVSTLTEAVSILSSSVQELKGGSTRAGLLYTGLVILMEVITLSRESMAMRPAYYWLGQSFKAGLLGTLMDISGRFPDNGKVVTAVDDFLTKVLPAGMVDQALLTRVLNEYVSLARAMRNLELECSILHPPWNNFLELVDQCSGVLAKYETAVSSRACDNESCDVIRAKTRMSRCSNCQTNYYCSHLCQIQDWRMGGHRDQCRILRASKYADPFSNRQLSFMRALLHDDYLTHRSEVLARQIGQMIHNPNGDFYTMFCYTDVKLKIRPYEMGAYPADDCDHWHIDWEYHARRKRQSNGRMDLHLMVFSHPGGTEARMFPKRSRDDRVVMGQREIAERPQRPEGDELNALLLELSEKDEGCIH
ncbi:MYND-type domain-containing protein [Mycena venus]|uniref:MYND-type domain-containing protein n=1 Tax=Mycena venus TaxID=2733690 RepID=A0A8H6Z0V1_9AGAR|nr:MYND-type domain-containing protein [Mycena venus]